MPPIAFECAGPLVKRTNRPGIRAIPDVTAGAPGPYQIDVPQHAQVLGDRRLRQPEGVDDVRDGTLVGRQEAQDGPPLLLGDGVEHIGTGGGSGHASYHIPITEYVKAARAHGRDRDDINCSMASAPVASWL